MALTATRNRKEVSILHEQCSTGHEVPAIPDAVRTDARRVGSVAHVQHRQIVHLLLAVEIHGKHRELEA
jgi:hypothetical protein